jgi:2-methylcitrate dehydratase PrpD
MTSQLAELGRRAAAPATQQTRGSARLHLFDALVAACAASATSEAGIVASHLEGLRPGPRETSPADLVLALARRIRATELDDLQLESVTTAAAAVVPALVGGVAVAGKSELSADAVLDAATAGYDVMWTLGLAVGGPDFLYRQGGWPSLIGAAPAAAATTARLLGLDPEEIAHAIALAALSTPRSLRGNGEDGRWLTFGLAVTAGFHAALAARSGARGDLSLLDQASRRGTPGRELFPGLPSVLERPWAPGHGLARAHLKQWASAGQVAAAIDAAGVLQDAHGFSAAEVTAVDVHVPPAYRRMIDQPNGTGRMWSLVSAQYQVAVRLLHPQDLFDCARRVTRDDPGFRRLMGVVRVHEDELLAARHPETYPARVTVTLRSGHSADYLSAGRSPSPRWDWDSLLVKARAVATHAATGQRIDPLRDAITGFSDSIEFLRAAMAAVLPFDGGKRQERAVLRLPARMSPKVLRAVTSPGSFHSVIATRTELHDYYRQHHPHPGRDRWRRTGRADALVPASPVWNRQRHDRQPDRARYRDHAPSRDP